MRRETTFWQGFKSNFYWAMVFGVVCGIVIKKAGGSLTLAVGLAVCGALAIKAAGRRRK